MRRAFTACALAGLLATVASWTVLASAQLPIPGRGIIDRLPSLSDVLAGRPLTTTFADATGALPMLDDYDPVEFGSLWGVPAGPGGGASLAETGLFTSTLESYCLMPGAARPRAGGTGYLSAPLKGPGADVIDAILKKADQFPSLPQNDIQLLIWNILARTPVDAMSGNVQAAARVLLTRDQITRVNGGALGRLPEAIREQLVARADAVMAPLLDAEARIRDIASRPDAAYDEIEAIAAPFDIESTPSSVNVPLSRWSYDPRGYFVRYHPASYQVTTMQQYVPVPMTIRRDADGRPVVIDDRAGHRLQITYGQGATSVSRNNTASSVSAVPIASVQLTTIRFDPRRKETTTHSTPNAWTLTSGRSTASSAAASQPTGWAARLAEDATWERDLTAFGRQAGRTAIAPAALESALDFLRLRRALRDTVPAPFLDRLANAFQLSLCQAAGRCGAPATTSRLEGTLVSLSMPTVMSSAVPTAALWQGGAGESSPAGTVLTPPGDKDQRIGPSNRNPCLSPEDQAKLQDRQDFVQQAIDALSKGMAADAQGGANAPHLDGMNEDQFYDWFKSQLGGNVVTLGTNSGGTVTINVKCADGDAFCEILRGETWMHEAKHGQNAAECANGVDNGTCGTSGRDYAADELSAYSRSAEYLKNVKANRDRKCQGASAPSVPARNRR